MALYRHAGVVFTLLLLSGCQATNFFDMTTIFGTGSVPSSLPSDTTVVDGPPGIGGKVLNYGPNAQPVYTDGGKPAYLIYALSTSPDFTYYTWFRMTKKLVDGDQFTLFSVQGVDGPKLPVYFSVGLSANIVKDQDAENTDGGIKEKLLQKVFMYHHIRALPNKQASTLVMSEEFQPNKWYQLEMRVTTPSKKKNKSGRKRRATQNPIVQVRVNCHKIGEFELTGGPFEKFPAYGYAAFGSTISQNRDKEILAKNRFPGAMAKSQMIFGADAFTFYSPCDASFAVQDIPSEPLPSEYSDTQLKAYQKLSENSEIIVLTCEHGNDVRYFGETWEDNCYHYECADGVVKKTYNCVANLCTDPETKKKYIKGETWFDSKNNCLQHKCVKTRTDITSTNITCTKLDCVDKFDPIQVKGVCCPKCASDTCTGGKKYNAGCKRTCDDGADFACKSKKNGCWCPEDQVENEKGECVQLRTCPCKSGKLVYLPGQTATRSACSTCICLNGKMFCFERC